MTGLEDNNISPEYDYTVGFRIEGFTSTAEAPNNPAAFEKTITAGAGLIINGRLTEGAYAENKDITGAVIPEGTKDIGEVAFFGCSALRRVELPKSLKIIREEAFGESGLEKVRIPEETERICEKAFFSCRELKSIEVPGKNTVIETDAFGDCPKLTEGYIAAGYPGEYTFWEELLYTLLWCTCPERHNKKTNEHAIRYIQENEKLVMERILKTGNSAALSGISKLKLLRQENIHSYITAANENKQTELITLLLAAAEQKGADTGEFDL